MLGIRSLRCQGRTSALRWAASLRLHGSASRHFATATPAGEEDHSHVLVEMDEKLGVANVSINRPKVHNAFSDETIAKLTFCFEALKNEKGLRAVFVRGKGKNFCAGGDLNYMKRTGTFTHAENVEDGQRLGRMLFALNSMPVPTVALVHGAAMGGGVGMVSVCDVAVGLRESMFALSEVRLGLCPATISPYVVSRIGVAQARRYFLTGERFDGETARRIGLLHDVVENEAALEAYGERLCGEILRCSPDAVRESKKLIETVAGRRFGEELIAETGHILADMRAADCAQEGMAAFLEKRKPNWVA